jgi:hypothetical protein
VDPDLAGETVMLWWGIFDNELYIEHGEKRFGPYSPIGGPIPLHRYRAFKKTSTQQRADRIEGLAEQLALPSEKLSTPLQFEYYLTRALEEAYKVGQKPVGADMIENVLAKDINGLEPRLTRQGYNAKVLAELLNAKPREIKSFLSGQLASGRTQELQSELLAAGIPL